MSYLLHLGVLLWIYWLLSLSLDLLVGHTGVLSATHAAFFGFGAYAGALMALGLSVPWAWALLFATLGTAALGILVGSSAARLSGDYLLLSTLAFQVAFVGVLKNLRSVTGGPLGLGSIPAPSLFGASVDTALAFLVLAALLVGLAFALVRVLIPSPFGRALRCVRDDEVLARSLGKNTLSLKLAAFAIAAGLAGAAGALYASYLGFIEPDIFGIDQSILILAMVIVGGPASRFGPLFGAGLLLLLPELLRFLGLPSATAANLRQIAYGALLVLVVAVRPRGLAGRYSLES